MAVDVQGIPDEIDSNNRARADANPLAAAMTPDKFALRPDDLERALDVVAICRSPRR